MLLSIHRFYRIFGVVFVAFYLSRNSAALTTGFKKTANEVICPDKSSKCPDNATCCQLFNKQYGCCPLPDAVCCSDHMHCCPSKTRCDIYESKCISLKGSVSLAWNSIFKKKKLKSAAIYNNPASVKCSDGKTCPGFTKCCNSTTDDSLCCPLKDGVCCENSAYCCPKGFRCETKRNRCTRSGLSLDANSLLSGLPGLEEAVICNDGSECPRTSKCCHLHNNEFPAYGCCPLHEGVCCGLTCCSKGYRCAENYRCKFDFIN